MTVGSLDGRATTAEDLRPLAEVADQGGARADVVRQYDLRVPEARPEQSGIEGATVAVGARERAAAEKLTGGATGAVPEQAGVEPVVGWQMIVSGIRNADPAVFASTFASAVALSSAAALV